MKTIGEFFKEHSLSMYGDLNFYNSFMNCCKGLDFPLYECYYISGNVNTIPMQCIIFFMMPNDDLIGNFVIKPNGNVSVQLLDSNRISKLVDIIVTNKEKLNKNKREFIINLKCTMIDDFHMKIEEYNGQ